jgi:hypothetical protein
VDINSVCGPVNLDPFIFFCYFLRWIWNTTDVLTFVFFSGMDVPPFGVIEVMRPTHVFIFFFNWVQNMSPFFS